PPPPPRPCLPLSDLADQLERARGSLAGFAGEDPVSDARAVFSWSYDSLSAEAADLFRMLGLHPGPDFSEAAAASLLGGAPESARMRLGELVRAHLVTRPGPDRYAFHDLLRDYATERGATRDTEPTRQAAQHRLLDHYLRTAHAGAMLLSPARAPITLVPAREGVSPEPLDDHDHAMAWFTRTHPTLLALIRQGVDSGFGDRAWQLFWSIAGFQILQGHWADGLTTGELVLDAARKSADPWGEALVHHLSGRFHLLLERLDEAERRYLRAIELYGRLGDRVGQATAHLNYEGVWEHRGQFQESLRQAERALELYARAEHRIGEARALSDVGWYQAQLGEHRSALPYCQRALALQQANGDRIGESHTWDSLGYIHRQLDQYPQAVTAYRHAAELRRALGDLRKQADSLARLGEAHRANADAGAARRAWREAKQILTALGDPEAEQIATQLRDLDTAESANAGHAGLVSGSLQLRDK
ncbi:MAG: tetratricopeptide repeat protein, partial [Micromonosporaceae bacterium]